MPGRCSAEYMQAIQSHTAELLRHPCGASVVDALYDKATGTQRSTLAAHFYGREFTLFPPKVQHSCRLSLHFRRNTLLGSGEANSAKLLGLNCHRSQGDTIL